MAESDTIVEDYKVELRELKENNKPRINFLTILADEGSHCATGIVKSIENHIHQVNPCSKLFGLYLIDSIVKNCPDTPYKELFSKCISNLFLLVFREVDENVRLSMYKLRQTWTNVFPTSRLYNIDMRIHEIDPAWHIMNPPKPNIHVNPKFLDTDPRVNRPKEEHRKQVKVEPQHGESSGRVHVAPNISSKDQHIETRRKELAKEVDEKRKAMEMKQQAAKSRLHQEAVRKQKEREVAQNQARRPVQQTQDRQDKSNFGRHMPDEIKSQILQKYDSQTVKRPKIVEGNLDVSDGDGSDQDVDNIQYGQNVAGSSYIHGGPKGSGARKRAAQGRSGRRIYRQAEGGSMDSEVDSQDSPSTNTASNAMLSGPTLMSQSRTKDTDLRLPIKKRRQQQPRDADLTASDSASSAAMSSRATPVLKDSDSFVGNKDQDVDMRVLYSASDRQSKVTTRRQNALAEAVRTDVSPPQREKSPDVQQVGEVRGDNHTVQHFFQDASGLSRGRRHRYPQSRGFNQQQQQQRPSYDARNNNGGPGGRYRRGGAPRDQRWQNYRVSREDDFEDRSYHFREPEVGLPQERSGPLDRYQGIRETGVHEREQNELHYLSRNKDRILNKAHHEMDQGEMTRDQYEEIVRDLEQLPPSPAPGRIAPTSSSSYGTQPTLAPVSLDRAHLYRRRSPVPPFVPVVTGDERPAVVDSPPPPPPPAKRRFDRSRPLIGDEVAMEDSPVRSDDGNSIQEPLPPVDYQSAPVPYVDGTAPLQPPPILPPAVGASEPTIQPQPVILRDSTPPMAPVNSLLEQANPLDENDIPHDMSTLFFPPAPKPVVREGEPAAEEGKKTPELGVDEEKEVDDELAKPAAIPPNKTIYVDGRPYDVLYVGDHNEHAVIERNNLPHRIYFVGPPRNVVIDGQEHMLGFSEEKMVTVDGQQHSIRFGGPARELYIGRYPMRGSFGGPTIFLKINKRPHRIQLCGPPPEVKIDPMPDYDLLRYMPSRIDAKLRSTSLQATPKVPTMAQFPVYSQGGPPPPDSGMGYYSGPNCPPQQPPPYSGPQFPMQHDPYGPMPYQMPSGGPHMGQHGPYTGPSMQGGRPPMTIPGPRPQLPGFPPALNSAAPAQPKPSDMNSLIKKLLDNKFLEKFTAAETDKSRSISFTMNLDPLEKKAKPPTGLKDFNMHDLRCRYESAVSALYPSDGLTCNNCGQRFTNKDSDKYGRHLDWHFDKHRKESARHQARNWCIAVEDWINYDEMGEEAAAKARSAVFENEKSKPGDAQLNLATGQMIEATSDNEFCAICDEKFDQIHDDEEEIWKLKNAIQIDGKAYHPACHGGDASSSKKPAEVPSSKKAQVSDTPTPDPATLASVLKVVSVPSQLLLPSITSERQPDVVAEDGGDTTPVQDE